MNLRPISIRSANEYVARWHRHHAPVHGALFALSVAQPNAVEVCGVAIVGRPVARLMQDGFTCEIVRVATDGTRNACSFLYGAAKRAALAMGYRRVVTYTLRDESGASLRAVGAVPSAAVAGQQWSRPSRVRATAGAIQMQPKVRWTLLDGAWGDEE